MNTNANIPTETKVHNVLQIHQLMFRDFPPVTKVYVVCFIFIQ